MNKESHVCAMTSLRLVEIDAARMARIQPRSLARMQPRKWSIADGPGLEVNRRIREIENRVVRGVVGGFRGPRP